MPRPLEALGGLVAALIPHLIKFWDSLPCVTLSFLLPPPLLHSRALTSKEVRSGGDGYVHSLTKVRATEGCALRDGATIVDKCAAQRLPCP